ncbi:transporter [Lithospermum erythrorhizon]|uniref:Transporter n=1 Tax=Lithospermum erythrorhizon TaxID=34254 RepID=A0AAV3Q3C6_LITER
MRRNNSYQEGDNDDEFKEKESMEKIFKNVPVPKWTKQITFRSIVTSLILSVVFTFIVMKLNLTTGVIPSLNVAAGLLGFAIVRSYTQIISKLGLLKQPFTRQENTVIQTCVVASSGIAFSSGLASYLLGMSDIIASQEETGNTPINIMKLNLGWIMGFLFAASFIGLFSIMPLRKMMILRYKLTYPSGTATAYLVNSFHTPKGAKLAKKQVGSLFKSFGFSFIFGFFQWFFTGGDSCGFSQFPTFGLKAFAHKFYFDFSATYVGVGMICPYMVNFSLLIGAIVSWGLLWPWIQSKKGDWYPSDVSSSSLHGLQGYKVFLAIAMILGDGLFQFVFMTIITLRGLVAEKTGNKNSLSITDDEDPGDSSDGKISKYDDKRRVEYFLKDSTPNSIAIGGYVVLAIMSIIVVPIIFGHRIKWYHILVAYLLAPLMAFCNAYGCGLTDWSLASNYGKIAILVFSSWVGLDNGGIIAGLAACGVMMNIVSTASDLMQDFKTGYLTLASPRSMFVSQILGTGIGCVISPLVFWFFKKAYGVGDPDSLYPAPYAVMYRGMALLGVEGVASLPKNCLKLAVACFAFAILVNILTVLLRKFETTYKTHRFIPNAMCMAIPFYLGGYFAIDMCVGSLILYFWQRKNKKHADDIAPAVASGLICGDSLWGIPAAILSLASIKPPMCMMFLSSADYVKVYSFLNPE